MSTVSLAPNELADLYDGLFTLLERLPMDTHTGWECAVHTMFFGGDGLAAGALCLDEPSLPLTFHDCLRDGAALDRLRDEPDPPPHVERLACPQCGEAYVLDRDTGALDPETDDEYNGTPSEKETHE